MYSKREDVVVYYVLDPSLQKIWKGTKKKELRLFYGISLIKSTNWKMNVNELLS
jgi:hypothetical protein